MHNYLKSDDIYKRVIYFIFYRIRDTVTNYILLNIIHLVNVGKQGTGKMGTEKRTQEKWAQEKRAQVKN